MKMDEVIARINVLAKKAKAEGLTPEELAERDKLRRIYIDSVKANLVGQLENTYIIGTDGVKRKAEVVALTQEMENCIPDTYRDSAADARELGRILDAFLRTLTPDNQMVFLRRYWYVDTIAEIAARYGISESAVQMRLNRTKQKLSAYLAKEGIRV